MIHLNRTIHLNFAIEQTDIPALIGSQGSTVKQLEKETNTNIGVQRDVGSLDRDFSKLRRIQIKGTKQNVAQVLVEVIKTITPETDAPFLQLHILPGEEATTMDSLTLRQKEGLRKLESINAECCAARVKVVSLGPFGTVGIEILSISEEPLVEAITKVVDLLEDEEMLGDVQTDRKSMIKLVKKSIDEQVKFITTKEAIAFLIPYDKTTALIGPKGATIKELEKTHDVKLVVEKPESSHCSIGRTVLVRGTIEKIGECLAAATAKIFKDEDIQPRVIMLLPPGIPRYLIGHSGENIKRVEKESECNLEVERTEIRQNGEITGEMEYCQITGTEDTIAKGIQAVAARILIQLDIQGQTSEATIPVGADFGRFIEKALAGGYKAMIGRNAQRNKGKGFANPQAWPTESGVHPPQSWPMQPRRVEFGPSSPTRGSGYGGRGERREPDEWVARARPTEHHTWQSNWPAPGTEWPTDVRGSRDHASTVSPKIDWGPGKSGSNWAKPHVSSGSSGIDWGTRGSSSGGGGGWGASRPWKEAQPSRGSWGGGRPGIRGGRFY